MPLLPVATGPPCDAVLLCGDGLFVEHRDGSLFHYLDGLHAAVRVKALGVELVNTGALSDGGVVDQ